jgi:Arc/MetJ-type ribon-helix-helix transcriptional regulator
MPVSERTVTIEVNQQQEQMLDRLVAEGKLGSTHGEVIRSGFVRFCEAHPELSEGGAARGDGGRDE